MKPKVFGILPMAGKGSRIQPIAFSKELYPVSFGSKHFAISEFTIRSMARAHVHEIKLVVHPNKLDIANYYAHTKYPVSVYFYASKSLPESCLFPINGLRDDDICLFGLPDTLFTPLDAFAKIKKDLLSGVDLSLGIFQVEDGSKYDSVKWNEISGKLEGVLVKTNPPLSNWIWGIWGANVKTLKLLRKIISTQKTGRKERLLGVGFDKLSKDRSVITKVCKLSNQYFDIGTMDAVVKINEVIKNFEL